MDIEQGLSCGVWRHFTLENQGNEPMGFFSGTTLNSLLTGITGTLTTNGVTGAQQTSILQQLGGVFMNISNPNYAAELALAAQIMQFAGNPAVEAELINRLITEQGLPASAAAIAGRMMTKLGTPAYDPTAEALQIEQIIRSGS